MNSNFNDQQNNQQCMGDREIMDDSLSSEKYVTSHYDTSANECVSPKLRSEMLNILQEEHQIQADIFNEMQTRGWYQTSPVEQQKVDQAKQKFQNFSC